MSSHMISRFDVADNGHPMDMTIKPVGHFVLIALVHRQTNLSESARVTPRQARRVADALRVAAREAEANGRPVDLSAIADSTNGEAKA